ncbi:MAG: hypothetical protein K1Y02_01140 [Candidatus Hydrogenedentes bacterium]|nr:hypothetical protein [Candidatus Hydrogenedentota bacterium]
MRKWRLESGALGIAVFASTVCAIWNAVDEFGLLRDWSTVAIAVCTWLAIPWLVGLQGTFTSKASTRRVNLALSVCFAALFAYYASNGSSADHGEGAPHMNLVIAPILVLFATLTVWGSVLLLRGLDRLRAAK